MNPDMDILEGPGPAMLNILHDGGPCVSAIDGIRGFSRVPKIWQYTA